MDWKKITKRPWAARFGLILLVLGVPGMAEDAVKWHEWTGNMNPHWFWLAAGVGGTLTTQWLVVKVSVQGKAILQALRRMFRNQEIKRVSQAEYNAGPRNPTTIYLVNDGGEDGSDDGK